LKEKNFNIKIILADPPGSSLYHKVMHNVCYTKQQAERTIRKHRYDSIVEGVGLDRITENFKQAKIDHAYSVLDQDFVNVSHWLIRNEGLFVGSSSALNITATLKALEHFPPGSNVVTVICDNGSRHMSRFYNADALSKYQLQLPYLDKDGNSLDREVVDDHLDIFIRSLFEKEMKR
jgi:cysteine synthase A